ncbi:MAG: PKD domain-containing protein [Paludibacteraceae bacterium]|nr:PKD domain-containing protein [Paludibacteraceae bacterium]
MKKIIMILMAFAMTIAGCKKVDVDFIYSPAAPRAGQVVTFTNKSSAGEKWAWDFGDNSNSISRNPTKVYKKPGTYVVTLMVDSAKYNTCSHTITVYDTVPTFVASTDSICHYQDVVFAANIYNPFSQSLSYQWTLPNNCILKTGKLTDQSIGVYFTSPNDNVTVKLDIQQGNKQHPVIEHSYKIYETKAPAILTRLTNGPVMRQRMINGYVEEPSQGDGEDIHMFEITSDTVVSFNDSTFYASKMQSIFPNHDIDRLQLDPMAQKWYITTIDGLFVANFSGQDVVLVDDEAIGALYVDQLRNLLLWGTPEGLKAMPLIKSKNNLFSTTPILYNDLSDIDRIVVNNKYR